VTQVQESTHLGSNAPAREAAPASEDAFVRLSRWLLYAGLAGSSILAPRFGDFTVGDAFLAASVVALLTSMARSRRPAPCQGLRWAAFHITVIGGIAALIGTGYVPAATSVLLRVVFVGFVLPWVINEVLSARKYFDRAIFAFVLGTAITGFGCILQLAFGSGIIPQGEVTNAGRYSGFTGHVSDTGGITCLAVIAGITLFLRASRRREVVVSLIALAGGVAGLVLSGSVAGMLVAAVIAGVAVILVRSTLRRRLALIIGVLAALAAVIAWPMSQSGGLDPIERFSQAVGLTAGNDPTTNTLDSRWTTIIVGWSRFLDAPFRGHGLDPGSADVYAGLPPHNLWVGALYQGGLIFTIGITLVIATSCYVGLRRFRLSPTACSAAFMALGAVFFALTAPSFYNRYFWLPLALAACAGAQDGPTTRLLGWPRDRLNTSTEPELPRAYSPSPTRPVAS